MEICILGNSHVSAIKTAWDQIASTFQDEVELTFFAARGDGPKNFALEGSDLVPQTEDLKRQISFTSGGLEKVHLDDFDVFVVYALGFNVIKETNNFYSEAVQNSVFEDRYFATPALHLVHSLRQYTDKPIYVGAHPFKASDSQNIEAMMSPELIKGIEFLKKQFRQRYNAVFIPQNSVTTTDGRFTQMKYCNGSIKLEVGAHNDGEHHEITDLTHMNAAYGKQWLKDFFAVAEV